MRKEELEDHVVKYRRHRVLAQQSGVNPEETGCLRSNSNPYRIDEKDFAVLDREASFQHWKETLEMEIFPGGIPDLEFQEEEEEEPLPPSPAINQLAPQTVVSLDGNSLKATLNPLLKSYQL